MIFGCPSDPSHVVAQHRLEEPGRVEHGGLRCGRHRTQIGSFGREVEQRKTELDRTLTIGDRVMQLQDQRRAATGQALQQSHLPQWAVAVEVGHALPARIFEHIRPGRPLGHAETADVEVQVEVRVDDHARSLNSDRSLYDTGPQDRRQAGGPLVAFLEDLPVRTLLQDQQADHGGAHDRVVGGHPPRREIPP